MTGMRIDYDLWERCRLRIVCYDFVPPHCFALQRGNQVIVADTRTNEVTSYFLRGGKWVKEDSPDSCPVVGR